jgi:hypothetical protein
MGGVSMAALIVGLVEDLEEHGARTIEGVAIRVAQRVRALAAAIWHNNKTGAPVTRSPGH